MNESAGVPRIESAGDAKTADLKDAFRLIGGRALRTAGVGAGLGAFHGAVGGTLDARNQGQSWKDSLQQGVRSAFNRGAIGAVAGGVAGGLSPSAADKIERFGKGVLHSTTGWVPKGGLAELQGGSWLARKMHDEALARGAGSDVLQNLSKRYAALSEAEAKGLTHLPGMVKGLVTPSRTLDTLRTSGRVLLDGTTAGEKAMMAAGTLAVPLMGAAMGLPTSQVVGSAIRAPFQMVLGAPLGAMTPTSGALTSLLGQSISGNTQRLLELPYDEVRRGVSKVIGPEYHPASPDRPNLVRKTTEPHRSDPSYSLISGAPA